MSGKVAPESPGLVERMFAASDVGGGDFGGAGSDDVLEHIDRLCLIGLRRPIRSRRQHSAAHRGPNGLKLAGQGASILPPGRVDQCGTTTNAMKP